MVSGNGENSINFKNYQSLSSSYSILTKSIRFHKDLSNSEKIILSEIIALCNNENNECSVTNNYFGTLYEKTERQIRSIIKNLHTKQLISIEIQNKNTRIIKINHKNLVTDDENIKAAMYAILPANIRYNQDISEFEKLLYCEIVSLTKTNGFCYSSNKYFAERFNKSECWISQCINNLKELNLLSINLTSDGQKTDRFIYLKELDGLSSEDLFNRLNPPKQPRKLYKKLKETKLVKEEIKVKEQKERKLKKELSKQVDLTKIPSKSIEQYELLKKIWIDYFNDTKDYSYIKQVQKDNYSEYPKFNNDLEYRTQFKKHIVGIIKGSMDYQSFDLVVRHFNNQNL